MNNFFLFIDTEASGLPKRWNAPYSKENNWPHCVQVAWVIYTHDGNVVKQQNHYIKDNDFKIAPSAIKIHGITREYLNKEGESRHEVLTLLKNDLEQYEPVVIGHFVELDYHVLSAEYFRSRIDNPLIDLPLFCTMVASKGYIIDSPVKYLKLFDLYKLLFNESLQKHHNAIVDARATAECFFELLKRGKINADELVMQVPVKPIEEAKPFGCSLALLFVIFITVLICYSV